MAGYTPVTPDSTKITIGPCDIYIDDTLDVSLGSTIGETEIDTVREFNPVETEQETGDLDFILTKESCTVSGTLAEGTLANIGRLLGGSTGFGGGTVTTYAWVLKTASPDSTKTRSYKIHKGIISTGTKISIGKGKQVGYPFKILCKVDTSKSAGERYISITDD